MDGIFTRFQNRCAQHGFQYEVYVQLSVWLDVLALFLWNFVGRQNAEQGFYPWINKDGNWYSGINAVDNNRLYNQAQLPRVIREDPSRNSYYFLPLILGILGSSFILKEIEMISWHC